LDGGGKRTNPKKGKNTYPSLKHPLGEKKGGGDRQ